jgi:hypothetical protein
MVIPPFERLLIFQWLVPDYPFLLTRPDELADYSIYWEYINLTLVLPFLLILPLYYSLYQLTRTHYTSDLAHCPFNGPDLFPYQTIPNMYSSRTAPLGLIPPLSNKDQNHFDRINQWT